MKAADRRCEHFSSLSTDTTNEQSVAVMWQWQGVYLFSRASCMSNVTGTPHASAASTPDRTSVFTPAESPPSPTYTSRLCERQRQHASDRPATTIFLINCEAPKSARHHGSASSAVCMHEEPSQSVLGSPSWVRCAKPSCAVELCVAVNTTGWAASTQGGWFESQEAPVALIVSAQHARLPPGRRAHPSTL